jgi:hypothetical protein
MQRFAFAAAVVWLLVGCGDTPYKRLARGYRAVNLSARLAEQFDESLEKYLTTKHAECKKKHKAKTPEFDKCILPALRIVRAWTGKAAGKPTGKGVLPALQSAQKASRLALDAAYDYVLANEKACAGATAPAKCKADWKKLIKPSLCALSEIIDRAVKLGVINVTNNPTYKTVMTVVRGFACGR